MTTASLFAAWLVDDRWTVRAGLGMILNGNLTPEAGVTHDVNPGGLAAVGLEYRALSGNDLIPFIDLSMFFGVSMTETTHPFSNSKTNYFATDLRPAVRASWNVKGKTFPYLAARVFAGPVSWQLDDTDVTGSDIHHYQLAIGNALQFASIAVFAEWAPVGEQALSAGFSFAL